MSDKAPTIREVNARIQAALKLLDTDKADAFIGTPGPEHKVLIQGVQAAMGLLWAATLKRDKAGASNQEYFAKTQVILMQMLHIAYALGIKRGRSV